MLARAIIVAGIFATTTQFAMASDCAQKLDPKSATFVTDLLACLKSLESENNDLKNQPASGVPQGAVVAFDLPGGCPHGWSMFERGTSRTIIGATQLSVADVRNLDINKQRLSAHPYQSDGGEETHTLTVAEIPSHDHGIQIIQHSEYLRENNKGYPGTDTVGRDAVRNDPKWPLRYTEVVGGGQSHNIMPPFIALFYCRKD